MGSSVWASNAHAKCRVPPSSQICATLWRRWWCLCRNRRQTCPPPHIHSTATPTAFPLLPSSSSSFAGCFAVCAPHSFAAERLGHVGRRLQLLARGALAAQRSTVPVRHDAADGTRAGRVPLCDWPCYTVCGRSVRPRACVCMHTAVLVCFTGAAQPGCPMSFLHACVLQKSRTPW